MNNVVLIGRLTRDPELRYTSTQMAVATMTIAVDRGKDSKGQDKGADFPIIKVFGKQAENCDKYLFKGRKVAIQGGIHTDSYEDKEGKRVYKTEVIANRVEFLEGNKEEVKPDESDVIFTDDEFITLNEDIPF